LFQSIADCWTWDKSSENISREKDLWNVPEVGPTSEFKASSAKKLSIDTIVCSVINCVPEEEEKENMGACGRQVLNLAATVTSTPFGDQPLTSLTSSTMIAQVPVGETEMSNSSGEESKLSNSAAQDSYEKAGPDVRVVFKSFGDISSRSACVDSPGNYILDNCGGEKDRLEKTCMNKGSIWERSSAPGSESKQTTGDKINAEGEAKSKILIENDLEISVEEELEDVSQLFKCEVHQVIQSKFDSNRKRLEHVSDVEQKKKVGPIPNEQGQELSSIGKEEVSSSFNCLAENELSSTDIDSSTIQNCDGVVGAKSSVVTKGICRSQSLTDADGVANEFKRKKRRETTSGTNSHIRTVDQRRLFFLSSRK
jgi:hypothetical protein